MAASIAANGVSQQESGEASPDLASRLRQRKKLVLDFPANKFVPTWFFGTNCHWQTIVGTGALMSKIFGRNERTFGTTEEVIDTPDGDFFDVEYTLNFPAAKAVVIVLHGLESTSKGELVTSFTTALMSKGFACVMPNFRGCTGKSHKRPGGYHVGFTADVDHLVSLINSRHPDKHIFLCGFSLGGNVLLKFLGEQGEEAWNRNIRGCAVTCVPFDPTASHYKLDVGFNRAVYSENFLLTMKAKAESQIAMFPGSFNIDLVRRARTIGEIDDYYIAPLYGFRDKFDYYEQNGSKRFLHKICVPTVAINAIDDPFIEAKALPTQDHVKDAPVRLIYHAHGGHCGFWARRMSNHPDAPPVPPHGWLAEELARSLAYLRDHDTTAKTIA